MLERNAPTPSKLRHLKLVAVGLLGFAFAIAASVYLVGPGLTPPPGQTLSDRDRAAVALVAPESTPESLLARAQHRPTPVDSGATSSLAVLSRAATAAGGQYNLDELSAEETKLLHARQHHDLERMLSDLDAVVIGNDDADGTAITLREIRALHEQQRLALNSADEGEVAIPASPNGAPALTVANVRALHAEQEKVIRANPNPASADEIVISGSVSNGTAGLTRGQVAAMHERQHAELESATAGGVMHDYPAPVGDNKYYLTVNQLRELHEAQSQD